MPVPEIKAVKGLDSYVLLGRTGLKVSPLCLGTMTFGTEWGWGADKSNARSLLMRYLEVGGNFVDTADGYTNGTSEEWLGEFIEAGRLRDGVVLATKYSFNGQPGNPNTGGNNRKNMMRAIEGSLRRLRTDYIDLYWMHAWDTVTPIEEVMTAFDALVRQGKIRYVGFSDVPAWYAARAQTLAESRGWERVSALQLEYSLASRSIEHEHVPMARELGMGLCAWSPLAGGFLSGKYKKSGAGIVGNGRIKETANSGNPVMDKFTSERNWRILAELESVAKQVSRPPAEVALNWLARRPGVTSIIIGATKPEQLESNLRSLSFELPDEAAGRLEQASRPASTELADFFGPVLQRMIHGVPVRRQ